MRLSPEVVRVAQSLIADRLGLDVSNRATNLEDALGSLVARDGHPDVGRYLTSLAALPDESPEWQRLASALTVGETYFFRDPAAFDALETQVLPSLIAERRTAGTKRLRIWSAACASGEEPYSLAILLDRLLRDRHDWSVTLLATDINPEALRAARRGIYREWSLRGAPPSVVQQAFRPLGDGRFELEARIRRTVSFATLNLAADVYPDLLNDTSAMDLILCRNVLMYFTRDGQEAVVGRLRRALVPGGWLAVSPAEASVELLRLLDPVQVSEALFYRRPGGDAELVVAPLVARPPPPDDVPMVQIRTAQAPPLPEPQARPEPAPPIATPVTLFQQARDLADRGRLDEARLLCEQALGRDRLNPELHLLLATIQQEAGEAATAIQGLQRAIYLAPESAAAHFALGSLLLRAGRRRPGRRSLEAVVRLLEERPSEEPVAWSGGLTAGRLKETARSYLTGS